MKTGIVGIGDMGSGLAKNLIGSGFDVWGFDPDPKRMEAFAQLGGHRASSASEVGRHAQTVFVMVMHGHQAKSVILDENGLLGHMTPGSIIILTATIHPKEAREIAAALEGSGIALIDSPVSGGFPGAQGGTLTMMAAGAREDLDRARPVMEAVSAVIHEVGSQPGMGQTVKACLQSLLGSIFTATFEAAALAAKAGVEAEVIEAVFSTSSGGAPLVKTALENIVQGQFEGTGSHINTMHKDLTISHAMALELGVPLFTASMAMQLFQAGRSKYPQGDNWIITKWLEDITGAKLRRKNALHPDLPEEEPSQAN